MPTTIVGQSTSLGLTPPSAAKKTYIATAPRQITESGPSVLLNIGHLP
jgi:hypothetical protein